MQRARLFVAAVVSLLWLALAGGAAGAPLTVQVVNERGVEQGSRVTDAAGSRLTNGYGVVSLDVEPGEVISASRADGAPEGAAGASYSVPSPVPWLARIVVPALPDSVDPAHDPGEAWLLAAVNGERAGLGLPPLQQSGSLNRAADVYARYLFETDTFSHTALFTASVRALDQGWPFAGGYGVGEVLALAQSKEAALEGWRGSSGHWTLLMSPTANVTGVARFDNRYVMSPSVCVATDAPERCEIGQSGVRVLGAPPVVPPVAGRGTGTLRSRKARLRVRIRRDGRRLYVQVRMLEGRGALRLAVRQAGRRARVRARRRGSLLRATAMLPNDGRWKVTVKFEGRVGWSDKRLAPRWVRVR